MSSDSGEVTPIVQEPIAEKPAVVEEEVSNDDFEKEYKGEVSKSGVAILPSKRMRRMVEKTKLNFQKVDEKEKG